MQSLIFFWQRIEIRYANGERLFRGNVVQIGNGTLTLSSVWS